MYTSIQPISSQDFELVEESEFHATAKASILKSRNDLTLRCTKSIYDWWASFEEKIPQKSDFQIIDHLRYASNLYLAEKLDEGVYKFLVCGEDVNNITGSENHNKTIYLTDCPVEGTLNFNRLIRYYDQILSGTDSYFCKGHALLLGKLTHGYESIDCPLLDKTGKANYILGAIQLT